ncbi:MAG: hypothetical protein A2Z11_00060 [Candidatus Woykebacteria bacterium RBG_16_43_9]|uniref:Transposase IS200-like domain-containing protein n=1 Tax=Candidatus Woykebacteria bacterium RBG_16_43_9 TaxID=1802596 RepID=A0A1G1WBW5_9BACT|nr:MAG: hypothetical protein A2Z11_00060 [Candidatus Woykebacteria bacterium RBG_16_43_9]
MPFRQPIFYKDGYYHVYSRGIEKRKIFLDWADHRRFLARLKDYGRAHSVTILAYCLMPNHYHLLVRQESDDPLSIFLQKLNLAYSMYFNKKYDRVGPLFQSRFKAKLVDSEEYLLELSRYIHLNPYEILMAKKSLRTYPWSSYGVYLSNKNIDLIVDTKFILNFFSRKNQTEDYKKFVEKKDVSFEGISNLIIE